MTSVAAAAARTGGFINVGSTPGKGSTISIFLPVSPDKPVASETGDKETPFGNGELVLVVEDDPLVRESVLKRLEAIGYAVIEAADASTALKLLADGEPVDLVFSDVVMPGELSGYGLAQQVRRLYPDMKVLMTSGHLSQANQPAKTLLSDIELLRKPYSLTLLAKAVARTLK